MTYDPYRMRTGLNLTEPDPAPRYPTSQQAHLAALMGSAQRAHPVSGVSGFTPGSTGAAPAPSVTADSGRFNTGAYGTPAVGPRGGRLPMKDYLPEDPFRTQGQIDMGALFTNQSIPQPIGTPPTLEGGGPGFAGTILSIPGSLLSMFNGEFGAHLTNLGKFIGAGLDLPFSGIRPIEALPGGQDVTKAFGLLPETEDKRAYLQAIADDPLHKEQFMLQFVRQHANDLASLQGIARPAGQFNAPVGDISQQLSQLVFGALSLPQMAIARTITGARPFDDLMRTDPNTPDELIALQNRLKKGEITRDQFLDDVSGSAFRYTNDTSLFGTLLSLGIDIISDPFTWATLGTGAAIGVGEHAAVESMRLIRLVAKGTKAETAILDTERTVFERMAREAAAKGTGAPRGEIVRMAQDTAVMDMMKATNPDLYKQALSQMSPKARAGQILRPYAKPANAIVNRVQDPLSWFGTDRAAKVFQSRLSAAVPQGFTQAYGAPRIAALAQYFEDAGMGANFERAFGVAAANSALLIQTRSLINDVIRSGTELTGNPKEWLRARMQGASKTSAKTMVTETQETVQRQMKDFNPTGVAGQAAVDLALKDARETAAKQLAEMTNKDVEAARRAVGKMDETSMAAIHHLYYGHAIDGMIGAREAAIKNALMALTKAQGRGNKKAIAKAQAHLDNVKRYTLISERSLDSEGAKLLRRALNGPDAANEARNAVRQFDIIAANFDRKALTDAELVEQMSRLVDLLLSDKAKRLPKRIDEAKLEPDMARWVSGQKAVVGDGAYRIALTPEDTWGLVTNPDGTLAGAGIWVDATNDHATPWRPMNRFDVLRMRLTTPIRGSRLLVEARRSFTRDGIERGLTKGQAENLFQALRTESSRLGVGPRGLEKQRIWEVAQKIDMPDDVRNKLEDRGIAAMLVRAYEGELSSVGVTSKISGKAKTTFAGRGDNYIARLAEELYPKLRFTFSKFFWAQEWVEGPFFNLLRGIKPGITWSDKDRAWGELLRNMRDAGESFVDQQEFILLSMATSSEVKRAMGPNSTRGERIRAWIDQATNLRSVKELNMTRMAAKESSDHFYEAINDINPSLWNRMVDEYQTTDRQKIMLQHFADRGALSDDARAVVHRMDGYKPANFGQAARINVSDVAADFGHQSGASLREAIRNGVITESDFRAGLKSSAHPDYIQRAWSVASGHTLEEWTAALGVAMKDKGADAAQVALSMNSFSSWARQRARIAGITPEEWLNAKLNALPHGLAKGDVVPVGSYFQTMEETLTDGNMEVISASKQPDRYNAIQRRQRELFERAGTEVRTRRLNGGQSVVTAQQEVLAGKVNKAGETVGALPLPLSKSREKVDVGGRVVLFGERPGSTPMKMHQDDLNDFFQFAQNVSPEATVEFSQWYDHMSTLWAGVASKLPDSTIHRLAEKMNAQMSGADETTRIRMGQPLENLRDEVAARLLMAFTGSQQNTSVRDGFTYTMRQLASTNGEMEVRIKKGLGVVNMRIEDMLLDMVDLPPGGWWQKLTDFADASSGKKHVRSMTENLPGALDLQPAAIDIWMKRVFGFMDNEYERHLTQRMVRTGQFKTVAEAREHLRGIHGRYHPRPKQKKVALLDEAGNPVIDTETGKVVKVKEPLPALPEGEFYLEAGGAPDKWQYESMLMRVNGIKDDWNRRGADGLGLPGLENKTDWTATDVQAQLWMSQQSAVGYPETSPGALFVTGGYTVPTEVSTPANGSLFANDFPAPTSLPEYEQINVARRLDEALAPIVSELSGVVDVLQMPGAGTWNDNGVARNVTQISIGSEVEAPLAGLVRAYLTQQESMFATFTPTTKELETMRSDPLARRRHWAVDFQLDASADMEDTVLAIKYMASVMPSYHKDPGWSGSMTAQTDEGNFVSRAVYMQPNQIAAAKTKKSLAMQAKAAQMTLADIQSAYELSPEVRAKMADGTWVHEIDPEHAPIPMTVEHRLVRVYESHNKNWDEQKARVQQRVAKGEDHDAVWSQEYGRGHLDVMETIAAEFDQEYGTGTYWQDKVQTMIRQMTGGTDASGQVLRGTAHQVRDLLTEIYRDPSSPGRAAQYARHRRKWTLSDGAGEDRPRAYAPKSLATGDDLDAAGGLAPGGPAARRGRTAPRDRLATRGGGPGGTLGPGGVDLTADPTALYQRGATGAVRGAMTFDTEMRGTMHIGKNPDPTTVVHELFHIFARDLDPSGSQSFLDAYVAATNVDRVAKGLKPMRRQSVWTVKAEEWAAREFERFLANGTAPSGLLAGMFNAYGDWAKDLKLEAVNPAAAALFAKFGEIPASQKYTFNADQQRIWGAGRTAIKAGEEQAHTTHYYRRGRTWLERSVNHPYLGLYPASYMWGKVLPELGRFLIKKPFGLNAPLGGLVAANHVYNSLQLSAQSDTDLRDFLQSNDGMVRMFNMLTPGIPWNIPVNMPLFARRALEVQQENQRRAGTSSAPMNFDPLRAASESIANAFTMGRDISQLGGLIGEMTQGTGGPEKAAATDSRKHGEVTGWQQGPNGTRVATFTDGTTIAYGETRDGKWKNARLIEPREVVAVQQEQHAPGSVPVQYPTTP